MQFVHVTVPGDKKGVQTMKKRILLVAMVLSVLLAGLAFPDEAQACDPVYHVVKAGQNLTQIARYYGVTVNAIVRANNLWNPNFIYPGQVLLIPVPCAPPPPPSGCTKIHIVKRGEYLKMIAARYGTTINTLVRLNGIKNPNLIYPGQRLKVPTPCPGPKPTPSPPPSTGPWQGEYWSNRDLSGNPVLVRSHQSIDFAWGKGSPHKSISADNFSARFTRSRYFDAGQYQFYVRVDDGVRVWLDNALVIDQWHDTAPREYTAMRQIGAGHHNLRVEYYEHTGGAQIQFWVQRKDGLGAWKGAYFNNLDLQGSPVLTRHDNAIDFNWGNRSPASGVTADYFSVRWTGSFQFVGGNYRFKATADDGIRIWLDDHLVLDEWRDTSAQTYVFDMDVSAGTHTLKVEYYENRGDAVAKVSWIQR
jgi:LysM repeat protein